MEVLIVDAQSRIEYQFSPTNIVLEKEEITLSFVNIDEHYNSQKHKPLFDFVQILFGYCKSPESWYIMISGNRFKFIANDFSVERILGYYTDMNLPFKGYYLN